MWSSYKFGVFLQDGPWLDVGGIFIFARSGFAGRWTAIYIGQTNSLKAHIPSHKRWDDANRLGATHIHARGIEDQATRDKIEQELIAAYLPSMNLQFNHSLSGFPSSVLPLR